MILSRKSFTYNTYTVIEKVVIRLPFRYAAVFQEEGCFLFVKGKDMQVSSPLGSAMVKQKDAVLLKCGAYFIDWISSNDSEEVEVIAIHLPAGLLKELYKNEVPEILTVKRRESDIRPVVKDDVLNRFVEGLEFYFENPQLINNDSLALKIKELILLLLQSTRSESIRQLFSSIFTPASITLTDVTNRHLYSNLSIEEISRLAGLSLSSFKREFQKHFHQSPGQYLQAKKIERAQQLLETSELTVSEVAYEVGYNDPSYFSRVFKTRTGHSPHHFQVKKV